MTDPDGAPQQLEGPLVMQAADMFVAGARQHDDMTPVILRTLL